ncbi:MAG: hypothetical protein ACYSU1_02805 [Planctomycetota bacterium]|jgi:hypothetical protein
MSLAPQRPNFVLIWIGVVMLTFSLAGKWILLEPKGAKKQMITSDLAEAGEPAINQASPTSGLLSGSLNAARSSGHDFPEATTDPQMDEILPEGWDFAGVEDFVRPEGIPEVLDEILNPTSQDAEKEEILGTALLPEPHGTQPDIQEVHHALLPVESSSKKTKKSHLVDSGKLDSRWRGGRYGRQGGARMGGGGGKGQDVLVRTTVEQSGKGRLLVRFYLTNPEGAYDNLADLIGRNEGADAQMLRHANEILFSMEQAVGETDEPADSENDADRAERKRLKNMQKKLVQHLSQRPGGVELVAELSPAQLDALMHKLSARSPKLRALMEG